MVEEPKAQESTDNEISEDKQLKSENKNSSNFPDKSESQGSERQGKEGPDQSPISHFHNHTDVKIEKRDPNDGPSINISNYLKDEPEKQSHWEKFKYVFFMGFCAIFFSVFFYNFGYPLIFSLMDLARSSQMVLSIPLLGEISLNLENFIISASGFVVLFQSFIFFYFVRNSPIIYFLLTTLPVIFVVVTGLVSFNTVLLFLSLLSDNELIFQSFFIGNVVISLFAIGFCSLYAFPTLQAFLVKSTRIIFRILTFPSAAVFTSLLFFTLHFTFTSSSAIAQTPPGEEVVFYDENGFLANFATASEIENLNSELYKSGLKLQSSDISKYNKEVWDCYIELFSGLDYFGAQECLQEREEGENAKKIQTHYINLEKDTAWSNEKNLNDLSKFSKYVIPMGLRYKSGDNLKVENYKCYFSVDERGEDTEFFDAKKSNWEIRDNVRSDSREFSKTQVEISKEFFCDGLYEKLKDYIKIEKIEKIEKINIKIELYIKAPFYFISQIPVINYNTLDSSLISDDISLTKSKVVNFINRNYPEVFWTNLFDISASSFLSKFPILYNPKESLYFSDKDFFVDFYINKNHNDIGQVISLYPINKVQNTLENLDSSDSYILVPRIFDYNLFLDNQSQILEFEENEQRINSLRVHFIQKEDENLLNTLGEYSLLNFEVNGFVLVKKNKNQLVQPIYFSEKSIEPILEEIENEKSQDEKTTKDSQVD